MRPSLPSPYFSLAILLTNTWKVEMNLWFSLSSIFTAWPGIWNVASFQKQMASTGWIAWQF